MKTVYEDFYKVHGCAAGRCDCEKNIGNCNALAESLCHEVKDCNDCMLENVGLARGYVPFQCSLEIMMPDASLVNGTVFPCLVKPYKKDLRRGNNGC